MEIVKKYTTRTFSSLKIRNFRLYFIGQGVSLIGTWMQTIGQGLLILKLTGSGTDLGLITALQFLPILILGPWGGVVADRFPKRKILFVTQSISGILALILGILVATNHIQIWIVYALALILGLVTVFDNPTRQTFAIELVGQDNLPNAVSLGSAEFNLARIIGPAVAGVLIASSGLATCFIINGLSYTAVLISLAMMSDKQLTPAPLLKKTKGQLREGFAYISKTPVLRDTLLMMALIGTLSYEFSVILPLFAQFSLHGNAGAYALLTSAMGLGAVFGSMYSATRHKVKPSMLVIAAIFFGCSILVATSAPTLNLAVAAMVLVGFFSLNFTSLGNVILQLESTPEMRGRVMSLWTVAFLGSTPIGGPIIGWLGEHIGPRWGLGVGGVAAIVAGGWGMFRLRRFAKQPIPTDFVKKSDQLEAEKESRIL